jgi:hypothetical protein
MAKDGLERLWEQLDGLDSEIVQLEARKVEVLRKIRSGQGVECGAPGPGVTLADMEDPVSCMEVAGVIGKRSDNVARVLRKGGLMVVRCGQGYYCQAKDAGALWRKFGRYWETVKVGESG